MNLLKGYKNVRELDVVPLIRVFIYREHAKEFQILLRVFNIFRKILNMHNLWISCV